MPSNDERDERALREYLKDAPDDDHPFRDLVEDALGNGEGDTDTLGSSASH